MAAAWVVELERAVFYVLSAGFGCGRVLEQRLRFSIVFAYRVNGFKSSTAHIFGAKHVGLSKILRHGLEKSH